MKRELGSGIARAFVVGSGALTADSEDTLLKPDEPLRGMDDLLALFHEAEKPREQWRVGTEAERIAVVRANGERLPYEGPISVVAIFERLIDEHGWEPKRERPDGPIIALSRGDGSVTLEPGSQIELSGAPFRSVYDGQAESDEHWADLAPVLEELGLVWLAVGSHPFASVEELGWVPKMRYGVMKDYMPTRGTMAGDMMTKTCTVQANLDYPSEEDAMRMLRVGLRAQPIVTAMYANSPWNEGRRSGYKSYRALAWLHMDPDRSGLLPFAWQDHPKYIDYVEWALDAPMFLVKRDGTPHYNTGQTFRSFMDDGFEGVRANYGDWVEHLSTLFPEVRLKSTHRVPWRGRAAARLVVLAPGSVEGAALRRPELQRVRGLGGPLDVRRGRDAARRPRPPRSSDEIHGARRGRLGRRCPRARRIGSSAPRRPRTRRAKTRQPSCIRFERFSNEAVARPMFFWRRSVTTSRHARQ